MTSINDADPKPGWHGTMTGKKTTTRKRRKRALAALDMGRRLREKREKDP